MIASFILLANLISGFLDPPLSARPWCYWYWVNGNVDERTITRDLEAMKRVGFGGLLLLDPRNYDKCVSQPPVKLAFGSPEWRAAVGYAVRECNRLGLEFTMNLSDCGGSLKGPWLTGPDGPKQLVCGINVSAVPAEYREYRELMKFEFDVASNVVVNGGWKTVGGVTGRWQKGDEVTDVKILPPGVQGRHVSLRFGYCLIPGRPHDVDVIDAAAVERHWGRMTSDLFAELGSLVGTTLTHVYSVSWEGAIPSWTSRFAEEFRRRRGYDILPRLPELVGFVPEGKESAELLKDFSGVRNELFRDAFYGTIRKCAHARGVKLYSESGGPWNRDPRVFREADQLSFLGVNDMPQGEFWAVRPAHHSDFAHNRSAANAAHVYKLPRASAEAFTQMDRHWSVWPEKLKRSADDAFVDGINHFVWHTFTCSPEHFGKPGIEYFAGTHLNPNVTWFEESRAFIDYLARCQFMLQAGRPVTDVAIYGGKNVYRHWGRYRDVPYDGARVAIPRGYAYDLLNDETLFRKDEYPVFIDASKDIVEFPRLPKPDFEGDFEDVIHRHLEDGTEIYFVSSSDPISGCETFRVRNAIAELWNPVDGSRCLAQGVRVLSDGRLRVPLSLPRDGSVFVVFRPQDAEDIAKIPSSIVARHVVPADGWSVDIGGHPFDGLGDWTKSGNPDIRYFSGRAIYRTSIDFVEKPCGDCWLYLGEVAGGVAHILVNGRDCGIAWCRPFRVRVANSVLAQGRNAVEVQVVNTWRNRLIGDCFLPAKDRVTRSCLKYKSEPYADAVGHYWHQHTTEGYCRNEELTSCGLYGPVEWWEEGR